MADEKNFENEEAENVNEETVEETVEEAVEETVEDAAEAAEAAVEETVEDAAEAAAFEEADGEVLEGETEKPEMTETEKAVAEALAQRDAEDAEKKAKSKKRNSIIAVIVAAVIVIGGVAASGFISKDDTGSMRFNTYGGWLPKLVNKYNHQGYVDVTGRTLGDILSSAGITRDEFLEMYSLPADMPLSTSEMALIYLMPAGTYAEMFGGIDYDTMKDLLSIPDTTDDGTELTEDTEWGIVEGEITISDYIGMDIEEFKEMYGLDESVTEDMKWKEVRTAVDTYQKNERIKEEKGETDEMTVESTADDDEDTADTEDTDAAETEDDTEATAEAE